MSSHLLDTATEAARRAGEVLLKRYKEPHQVIVKGFRDITTEADLEAEQVALSLIRKAYPQSAIVSEEDDQGQVADQDGLTWYIDPLDGTTNYARGLPTFSVSVAAAQDGEPICGAVYDPLRDQLFYGQRGRGAFVNERLLRVSQRDRLSDCIVLLDWPRDPGYRLKSLAFLAELAPQVQVVRSGGSAALSICYVAAGWADIYFQYTLKSWDVAAGLAILQEAGGMATDLQGQPAKIEKPDWLVTNGLVHEAALALRPKEEEEG